MENKILVSSDHHANWDALEKLFEYARNNNLPFVINGDVIGDYNFEELSAKLGLKFPYEIEKEKDILGHKMRLRALYQIIIKEHAKIFSGFIDKYKVKTYFLNGNHEPINFPETVKDFLENKDLFFDLGSIEGVLEINGIKCCGVSNVSAIMPFLYEIYSEKELNEIFSHQRGSERPMIYPLVDNTKILESNHHELDFDWVRIMGNEKKEIDVFFTHGQIGKGAWREDKFANEMPTLCVAAMLSHLSKLTVDGHLHTSHEMENSLGKKTIRGVGNVGYVLKKIGDEVKYEKVTVDSDYDHRGGMDFEKEFMENKIIEEIFGNKL